MRIRYQPPDNDADFERLCLELLRRHWDCPGLELNAHRGEKQHGADIVDFGGEPLVRAAQCKLLNTAKPIPPAMIRDEVRKAEGFGFPISEYYILTTGKRAAASQRALRDLNEEHHGKGLFSVHLMTWDDLVSVLNQHPDVASLCYPDSFMLDGEVVARFEYRLLGIQETLHRQADAMSQLARQSQSPEMPSRQQMLAIAEKSASNARRKVGRKYRPLLYVDRRGDEEVRKFVLNPRPALAAALVIVERAGSGKTNLLCRMSEHLLAEGIPTVLLLGSDPLTGRYSLVWDVLEALGIPNDRADSPHEAVARLEKALAGGPLCVLVDAVNEAHDLDLMKSALRELFACLGQTRARLVVTCRDVYWSFVQGDWAETIPTALPEPSMYHYDDEAWEVARDKYFLAYGITGTLVGQADYECRHPLLLRFFCEAYDGEGVGIIETLRLSELFDLYLQRKARRIGEELQLLRADELVVDTLERLAAGMIAVRDTEIPEETATEMVGGRDHLGRDSIYVRILDEDILIEVIPDSRTRPLRRNVRFVYEAFFEFVVARCLERSWAESADDDILNHLGLLLEPSACVRHVVGALRFLQGFFVRRGLNVWRAFIDRGPAWHGIVLLGIAEVPPDELDETQSAAFAELARRGSTETRANAVALLEDDSRRLRLDPHLALLYERLRYDPRREVRSAAFRTLGQHALLASPETVASGCLDRAKIIRMWSRELVPKLSDEAKREVALLLAEALASPQGHVRSYAAMALDLTVWPEARPHLLCGLSDCSPWVRSACLKRLREHPEETDIPAVAALLSDPVPRVRVLAAFVCRDWQYQASLPFLLAQAKTEPNEAVLGRIVAAITALSDCSTLPYLRTMLRHDDYWVCLAAGRGLYAHLGAACIPELLAAIRDRQDPVERWPWAWPDAYSVIDEEHLAEQLENVVLPQFEGPPGSEVPSPRPVSIPADALGAFCALGLEGRHADRETAAMLAGATMLLRRRRETREANVGRHLGDVLHRLAASTDSRSCGDIVSGDCTTSGDQTICRLVNDDGSCSCHAWLISFLTCGDAGLVSAFLEGMCRCPSAVNLDEVSGLREALAMLAAHGPLRAASYAACLLAENGFAIPEDGMNDILRKGSPGERAVIVSGLRRVLADEDLSRKGAENPAVIHRLLTLAPHDDGRTQVLAPLSRTLWRFVECTDADDSLLGPLIRALSNVDDRSGDEPSVIDCTPARIHRLLAAERVVEGPTHERLLCILLRRIHLLPRAAASVLIRRGLSHSTAAVRRIAIAYAGADPAYLSSCVEALGDRSTVVAREALAAIVQRWPQAIPLYWSRIAALARCRNRSVRIGVCRASTMLASDEGGEVLLQLVLDPERAVRREALLALARVLPDEALPYVMIGLKDAAPVVRVEACALLAEFDCPGSREALLERTADTSYRVRAEAFKSLAALDRDLALRNVLLFARGRAGWAPRDWLLDRATGGDGVDPWLGDMLDSIGATIDERDAVSARVVARDQLTADEEHPGDYSPLTTSDADEEQLYCDFLGGDVDEDDPWAFFEAGWQRCIEASETEALEGGARLETRAGLDPHVQASAEGLRRQVYARGLLRFAYAGKLMAAQVAGCQRAFGDWDQMMHALHADYGVGGSSVSVEKMLTEALKCRSAGPREAGIARLASSLVDLITEQSAPGGTLIQAFLIGLLEPYVLSEETWASLSARYLADSPGFRIPAGVLRDATGIDVAFRTLAGLGDDEVYMGRIWLPLRRNLGWWAALRATPFCLGYLVSEVAVADGGSPNWKQIVRPPKLPARTQQLVDEFEPIGSEASIREVLRARWLRGELVASDPQVEALAGMGDEAARKLLDEGQLNLFALG